MLCTCTCAIRGEQHIREKFLKVMSCVFGPILHIVPHCGLQACHELWPWCAQLLCDLVPLVNVFIMLRTCSILALVAMGFISIKTMQ